jgi:hypothetical protein
VQAEAPNNRERRRSKGRGRERRGKRRGQDHVMCVAERRKTEPPMNSRKRINDVETGTESLARDESGRYLLTDPGGVRLRGGVKLQQVLARNVGTSPVMRRENAKWQTHEAPSTDAWARGGSARSSEEGQ